MPAKGTNSSIFLQNFMGGFSFVDSIKQSRRSEARLEQQLKERREENAFQRKRQIAGDARLDDINADRNEDRDIVASNRASQIAGDAAAARDAPDEELLPHVSHSAAAAALIKKRNNRRELEKGFKGALTVPNAEVTQPQGNAVTQQAGAAGADAVPTEGAGAVDPVAGTSLFEGTRGEGSQQRVTEQDIDPFDPERAEKGIVGKFFADVAGDFNQAKRGFANMFEAGSGLTAPAGSLQKELIAPGPRAAGAAFAGDSFISSEYVKPAEFAKIADPQERAAVDARNAALIMEQRATARNPARNKLARPLSDQGALQEGGELARDEAQRQQNQIVTRYEDFLDTEDGALDEMAIAEPSAAAVDYFQSRATLAEVRPDMIEAVDRRMIPVLDAYKGELVGSIHAASTGSAEQRQLSTRLRNVNASQNVIAATQPKAARQAEIKPPGLKIGDGPRVNQVTNMLFDPDRPAPASVQPGQLNSAITVAGRIKPAKRLNDTQIESLAILADAGYLDKATALSVMMTGHWPPGKNPNAIRKTFKSGDTTYAQTDGGQVFVLPDPVGVAKRNRKDKEPVDRSLGEEQIKSILLGAASTGMDESRNGQVIGMMSDHAGWIRKHYNTDSQESMLAAGRSFGQSIFLSAKEHKRMAERGDDWNPFTWEGDAPTQEQIFLNPALRRELAGEYESRPVPMPAVGERSDLDLEPFKRGLAEGVHGERLREDFNSGTMTEKDILYAWYVMNAEAEDIANAKGQ